MARVRRFRRLRRVTIPLAPVIGVIASPAIGASIDYALKGDWTDVILASRQVIGIKPDGGFDVGLMFHNMLPIIVGCLVHKFVGGKPLNFNAALARAGVPYVRI